jgi:hypothetical protein
VSAAAKTDNADNEDNAANALTRFERFNPVIEILPLPARLKPHAMTPQAHAAHIIELILRRFDLLIQEVLEHSAPPSAGAVVLF